MHSVLHHKGEIHDLRSEDWLKTIEGEGFLAVIFDCDGTLVESSDAHMHCMQAAVRDQGVEMPGDWYLARTGLDRLSLLREFVEYAGSPFDIERAQDRSIALYSEFANLIRPIDAPIALAKSLWHLDVPLAVVTNAEHEVAQQSLSHVGILHLFAHVVSISAEFRPKPSPDMFDVAAKKLGIPTAKILVFEDSSQGVSAATAAGMSVIQLEHAPNVAPLSRAPNGG